MAVGTLSVQGRVRRPGDGTCDLNGTLDRARHAVVSGPFIAELRSESANAAPIDREAFAKTVEDSTFYILCSDILGRAVTSATTKLQEEMMDMKNKHVAEYNAEAAKLREIKIKYMERHPLPELAGARAEYEKLKSACESDASEDTKKKLGEAEERVKALTHYDNYWRNPHPMIESELKEVHAQFNKTVDVGKAADTEENKYRHEHDPTIRFIEEYCKEVAANYN